jgi:hypothetical protein
MELHALLVQSDYPSRDSWQAAIDALGLPLVLDADLQLPVTSGFVPCTLAGHDSGFEIFADDVDALLTECPELLGRARVARTAITFRWNGDLRQCACVLAAAAALVASRRAVVYYPNDDFFYDIETLISDFRQCAAG